VVVFGCLCGVLGCGMLKRHHTNVSGGRGNRVGVFCVAGEGGGGVGLVIGVFVWVVWFVFRGGGLFVWVVCGFCWFVVGGCVFTGIGSVVGALFLCGLGGVGGGGGCWCWVSGLESGVWGGVWGCVCCVALGVGVDWGGGVGVFVFGGWLLF